MVALAMVTTFSTLNGNISANTLQKELHSGWRFKQARLSNWYPATVPGVVHTDLIDNKIIEDPFYRLNERGVQWVDKEDWIYETTFDVAPELMDKNNIRLYFKGLDTYADVYLNGEKILEADNMFREWKLPVKDNLKAKDNKLRIYFHSPIKRDMPKWDALPFHYEAINDQSENGGVFNRKVSVFARKAGYHYGWDWGPRLVTSGIWRPVLLEAWDDLRIENVFIRQKEVSYKQADISNIVEILADKDIEKAEVTVRDNKTGKIYGATTTCLTKGLNKIAVNFFIKNPNLWWSNGLGKANLYEFRTEVKTNEQNKDCLITSTGIRSLKVICKEDKEGRSFYFQLNGIPVFSKGANYIPCDNFLPRVTKELYEKTILDAVNANMNTLRVWGGGTYEDDYFYELCDKYGILVWQDFMFACAMYPGDPEFLENVKQEAVDNVIRLRNHPCIALWCGNNEIDAAWRGWGWKREYTQQQQERIFKAYTDVFHRLLPEVIEKYTDGDDYWPSSPMSGPEIGDHEIRPANRGDNHYWGVWHEKHKFEEYEKNIGRFISEHGFQSFPEFETVRQYTLPEDYDIESEIMSAHQRSGIGNLRIREYMGWYYQVPEDFGQMLYMSQVLQARAMRIAMETHRRHMPYCMGSLVWQLNDCWPVASWSTTDYYHNWKAAQYALREACKPVILAPQVTADSLKLWVVNDLPTPLAGTYTLEIKGFDGKLHQTRQGKYKIKANEAAPIAASSIAGLLQDNSHRETMAVITIRQGKKIVDRQNVYFALPKELLLRQPDIQIQISEEQGKKYLTATTDRLACDVMFYLPGVKAVFTDNYKDLLPGHPFRTEIRTTLSKEEIEQQIRCRWVGK